MHKQTIQIRRKLLNLLSRKEIESLSQRSRPWLSNRVDLTEACILLWDQDMEDEINQAVKQMLSRVRKEQ